MFRSTVIGFTMGLMVSASVWAQPLVNGGYAAHEWGTFTSLQDSSGVTAEGMFHEDEALPEFVHGRRNSLIQSFSTAGAFGLLPDSMPDHCHNKNCDFAVVAGTAMTVTQKMETPVIYFYSQTPQNVKVDVDFPGGIITQYYPNVTDFTPPLGKVDTIANGHIHWDVRVSTDRLPVPEVPTTSIWAPSREVNANDLSVGGENEKLLFYRGLGHFDTPLRVTDNVGSAIRIQNLSDQIVPSAFLLNVTPTGAEIRALGAVPAHGELEVSDRSLFKSDLKSLDSYLAQATSLVSNSLVLSGLFSDEALAMVHTWQKSYFTTPGLRVLYVLPREWTDRLLPLSLTPEPRELVRTLVGRVEILTQKEEQGLLNDLKQSFMNHTSCDSRIAALGRFAESKLRRVVLLAKQSGAGVGFVHYLEALIQQESVR